MLMLLLSIRGCIAHTECVLHQGNLWLRGRSQALHQMSSQPLAVHASFECQRQVYEEQLGRDARSLAKMRAELCRKNEHIAQLTHEAGAAQQCQVLLSAYLPSFALGWSGMPQFLPI